MDAYAVPQMLKDFDRKTAKLLLDSVFKVAS